MSNSLRTQRVFSLRKFKNLFLHSWLEWYNIRNFSKINLSRFFIQIKFITVCKFIFSGELGFSPCHMDEGQTSYTLLTKVPLGHGFRHVYPPNSAANHTSWAMKGYPSCYTPGSFGIVIKIVQFTLEFCAICQMLGNRLSWNPSVHASEI